MTEDAQDNLDDLEVVPLTLDDLIQIVDLMIEEDVDLNTPICVDLFFKGSDQYLKEDMQIDSRSIGWDSETISLGSISL